MRKKISPRFTKLKPPSGLPFTCFTYTEIWRQRFSAGLPPVTATPNPQRTLRGGEESGEVICGGNNLFLLLPEGWCVWFARPGVWQRRGRCGSGGVWWRVCTAEVGPGGSSVFHLDVTNKKVARRWTSTVRHRKCIQSKLLVSLWLVTLQHYF